MPGCRSAATGSATPTGATSPSMRCRSALMAWCTTMSAGLPTSPRAACASSATPARRIEEDYLRILRFFRMHAAFGAGEMDRAGYLACIGGRAGLATLSAERVRMEMLKLLVAEGAAAAIEAMADSGLLQAIVGGVTYGGPFAAMIAAERALGLKPDAMRRLAALGRCRHRGREKDRDPTAALECRGQGARLHGSSLVAARRHGRGARQAAAVPARRAAVSRPPAARLGAHGRRQARWIELARLPERWTAPKFPLKAADFIARGIAEGPCARPGARARRGCLARRGLPAGCSRAVWDRRAGDRALEGRCARSEHPVRLCRYFDPAAAAGRSGRDVRRHRRRHRRATAPAR